jgi:hypothetical protein
MDGLGQGRKLAQKCCKFLVNKNGGESGPQAVDFSFEGSKCEAFFSPAPDLSTWTNTGEPS